MFGDTLAGADSNAVGNAKVEGLATDLGMSKAHLPEPFLPFSLLRAEAHRTCV